MNRRAFQVYISTMGAARREATLGNASNVFDDTYTGRMMLLSYVMQSRMVGNLFIDDSNITEIERIITFEDHPSDANVYIDGAFIIEWTVFGRERDE